MVNILEALGREVPNGAAAVMVLPAIGLAMALMTTLLAMALAAVNHLRPVRYPAMEDDWDGFSDPAMALTVMGPPALSREADLVVPRVCGMRTVAFRR